MVDFQDREFVGGFFDGDGSIVISPKESDPHPFPRIGFGQAKQSGYPPELLHIQSLYGGRLYQTGFQQKGTRTFWQLVIADEQHVRTLLVDLCTTCIVKQAQTSAALQYVNNGRVGAVEVSRRLQVLKDSTQNEEIETCRLSDAYLSGLFAADGSVGVYHRHSNKYGSLSVKLDVNITQKSCIRVLEEIRARLGYGRVRGGRFHALNGEGARFLRTISPYLKGQKAAQVILAQKLEEKWRSDVPRKRTVQEIEEMSSIAAEIKRLKKT